MLLKGCKCCTDCGLAVCRCKRKGERCHETVFSPTLSSICILTMQCVGQEVCDNVCVCLGSSYCSRMGRETHGVIVKIYCDH